MVDLKQLENLFESKLSPIIAQGKVIEELAEKVKQLEEKVNAKKEVLPLQSKLFIGGE
jgi:acyl-CoA reductase-like NAD-dependent aldehyde dehydrogenase